MPTFGEIYARDVDTGTDRARRAQRDRHHTRVGATLSHQPALLREQSQIVVLAEEDTVVDRVEGDDVRAATNPRASPVQEEPDARGPLKERVSGTRQRVQTVHVLRRHPKITEPSVDPGVRDRDQIDTQPSGHVGPDHATHPERQHDLKRLGTPHPVRIPVMPHLLLDRVEQRGSRTDTRRIRHRSRPRNHRRQDVRGHLVVVGDQGTPDR